MSHELAEADLRLDVYTTLDGDFIRPIERTVVGASAHDDSNA